MPRNDELATLIRCRASVAWLDADSNVVVVPSSENENERNT